MSGPPDDGDWSTEVDEIHRRQEIAAGMGGPDKVARQHASGRLTARERIDRLADPGSFTEIGELTALSGMPANFVAGTARLDGRRALLGVDDFTGRGGSGDAAIHAKQVFAEEYARDCDCRWSGCSTGPAVAAA